MFCKSAQKYPANHIIETKQANTEFECDLHCVGHGSCESVNYKSSENGKGRCKLNNKPLHEMKPDVDERTDSEFDHLTLIIATYKLENRKKTRSIETEIIQLF